MKHVSINSRVHKHHYYSLTLKTKSLCCNSVANSVYYIDTFCFYQYNNTSSRKTVDKIKGILEIRSCRVHLQYLHGTFDRGYMHIWKNLGKLNLSAGFSSIPGARVAAVPLTCTVDIIT